MDRLRFDGSIVAGYLALNRDRAAKPATNPHSNRISGNLCCTSAPDSPNGLNPINLPRLSNLNLQYLGQFSIRSRNLDLNPHLQSADSSSSGNSSFWIFTANKNVNPNPKFLIQSQHLQNQNLQNWLNFGCWIQNLQKCNQKLSEIGKSPNEIGLEVIRLTNAKISKFAVSTKVWQIDRLIDNRFQSNLIEVNPSDSQSSRLKVKVESSRIESDRVESDRIGSID